MYKNIDWGKYNTKLIKAERDTSDQHGNTNYYFKLDAKFLPLAFQLPEIKYVVLKVSCKNKPYNLLTSRIQLMMYDTKNLPLCKKYSDAQGINEVSFDKLMQLTQEEW